MKRRIAIWIVCFVVLFAWTGLVIAQTTKPAVMKTVKLPNGDEVCDLTGEWDALIENYGEWAQFGNYQNVIKMTLVNNSFRGIRLMDNGPGRPANSMIIEIDSEKNGFKQVILFTGAGPRPCSGKLSEDGDKIFLDLENKAKLTMTRK
jgi:hypothetical protein